MKLGIVSNCWKVLLDGGTPLEELIARGCELGYRVIELRQGALGAFEDARGRPLPELLSQLPRQFDDVQFNLAVEMPFLDPAATVDPVRWDEAFTGAQALSGRFPPHLRLVDLTTGPDRFEEIAAEDLAASLILGAEALAEANGCLSVEHAREPWKLLHGALSHARRSRPDLAPHLKLCYDPVNLLMTADAPDPTAVTQSLTADELSMVHFKQRRSGTPLPTVAEGEIDWTAQAAAIRSLDYSGPGLFEIAPHEDVWNHLEESRRYLVGCGMDMNEQD
jgi:sugar phosphate isomerase/epimerase